MTPVVSLIVGTRNRPAHLAHLLACLRLQTMPAWEVLLCDEGESPGAGEVVNAFADERVTWTVYPYAGDWHQSSRASAAQFARGEWLGFVPDDAYYCPRYLEFMVAAASREAWDLVYCDWVYDLAGYQRYEGAAAVGQVDVGGFLVRRRVYDAVGWPWRDHEGDGRFVVACAERFPHGRVAHVLYVKN